MYVDPSTFVPAARPPRRPPFGRVLKRLRNACVRGRGEGEEEVACGGGEREGERRRGGERERKEGM